MNPIRDWNDFWFRPRNLTNVGLFRIALGVVAIVKLALLLPIAGDFFVDTGMMTLAESKLLNLPPRLCVFDILPPNSAPVVFWVLLVIALFFTLGWQTRLMTVALFLGMLSIYHRSFWLVNGGDILMNILLFFGIFAPLGATWSVDRWLKAKRGLDVPGEVHGSYWAVRLMQFQVCLVYFWNAYQKIHAPLWIHGEAVYWALHNIERARWPVPSMLADTALGIHVLTYSALLVEGCFAFLVWIPRLRYYMLAAAALFHLGIEYSMTIQIFEWVMLVSYLLFIDGDDLERIFRR